MLETIVGDNGSRFVIAAGAVAIGLLCLVAVLWIIRRKPSSPFVRGGRNRQPRLAVLDAAAVDTRRRLVLIRRDDIEHLIMIGGPTDIVIESRIVADTAPASTPLDEVPVATAKQAQKPQKVEAETPTASPMRQMRVDEAVRPSVRPEPAPALDAAASPRPAPPAQPEEQAFASFQPAAPAIAPVSAVEPRRGSSIVPGDRVLPMARVAERVQPAQQSAPTEPKPVAQPQPVAGRPATTEKTVDFERMLDAEISSDLQRLTPTTAERQPSRPVASVRQEPMLGVAAPQASRETTIDEEMTRMLADISAGRKP